MKKLTRILAVLAAITTLTVSAVPAYAEEENSSITAAENDMQIGFDDDTQRIYEYINNENINAYSYSYIEENQEVNFYIEYINDEAKATVEKFIKDNGISMDHIVIREMKDKDGFWTKTMFIREKLNDFLNFENKLHFLTDIDTDENGNESLVLSYYYTHEDERPVAEKFIADKGYDKYTNIVFKSVGSADADPNEPITDPELKRVMIEDLITDQGLHAWTYINNEYQDENGEKLTLLEITIDDFWYDDDSAAPINEFIKEKNIDDSHILMMWLESAGAIPGDANGDFNADIRDCALIANKLAQGKADELLGSADYNKDGTINIRDAAGLAKDLANAYNYGIAEE